MRALLLLLLAACTPPGGEDGGVTSDSATPAPDPAAGTIRIATFNIESVGAPGSDQYVALAQVLARIDADVVGVNEVDELENDALAGLAMELGYDTVQVPQTNPFGALHNAILTRLEVVEATTHTSPSLSGDQAANDLTRWPVSVTLAGSGITVVTNHCKAGFDDIDEFRRTVDAIRTAQAPAVMDRAIVMGDLNHEIDEAADAPQRFTSIPTGAPGSFFLGGDLWDVLTGEGITNGPFAHLEAAGLVAVEAAQRDGRLGTRDSTGRRVDYVLVGSGLVGAVVGAEIYDSRDEHLEGLALAGVQPDRLASLEASDHFPVFVDLDLSAVTAARR